MNERHEVGGIPEDLAARLPAVPTEGEEDAERPSAFMPGLDPREGLATAAREMNAEGIAHGGPSVEFESRERAGITSDPTGGVSSGPAAGMSGVPTRAASVEEEVEEAELRPKTGPGHPCDLCGVILPPGTHWCAKAHSKCRAKQRKERTGAWKIANPRPVPAPAVKPVVAQPEFVPPVEDPEIISTSVLVQGVLPALVVQPGQKVALDDFVMALYRHLKLELGLSRNGILSVVGEIRGGAPEGHFVDVYLEMEQRLESVPFGTEISKRDAVATAMRRIWAKDVQLRWKYIQ